MKYLSIIKAMCCSFLIIISCVAGVAYKTMCSAAYRQPHSAEKAQKIETDRQTLLTTYNAQPVSFASPSGIPLSGLLVLRENAKRTILMCHGYGMSKEYMKRFFRLFENDNILVFDFRAHGESGGDLISVGNFEQHDVRAAFDFLKSHEATKELPIIGLGLSMGGAALLGSIAQHGVQCNGVIIDSSFADLSQQVAHSFTKRTGLPTTLFMPVTLKIYEYFAGYSLKAIIPAQFVKSVQCPLLIVHSDDDEMTPVSQAQILFGNATTQDKELWQVKKSKHGGIVYDYPEEYEQKIAMFLSRC